MNVSSRIEHDRGDAIALEGRQMPFQLRNGCKVKLAAQGDAGDAVPRADLGGELLFRPHRGSSADINAHALVRHGDRGSGSGTARTVIWGSAAAILLLRGSVSTGADVPSARRSTRSDAQMDAESTPRLRVLVADGPGVRLDEVTFTVAELGTMSSLESPRSRTSHVSPRPSGLT